MIIKKIISQTNIMKGGAHVNFCISATYSSSKLKQKILGL